MPRQPGATRTASADLLERGGGPHEEGRPRQGARSSSNSSSTKSTPRVGQTLYVVARAIEIVSRTGRTSVLMPYRCPSCHQMHCARVREPVERLQRRCVCDGTLVTLLAPVVNGAAS